ncbi:MAG TPA: FHA domain-containing protein [Pyrinomonadaceae bacterium]|jgi:hypothetical protein
MTTCDRCQTDNLDGAQYCDECGAPLNLQVQVRKSVETSDSDGRAGGLAMAEAPPLVAEAAPLLPQAEGAPQRVVPAFAAASNSLSATPAAHARLVIERGRSAGKQFPLCDDETQIGRWDADGGIFPDVDLDSDDPEAKVSRRHARIMRRNGQYFIEDLGSTNGTFINRGRRLLPGDRQPLRDGDEIIVGKTFMRFHIIK